MRTGNSQSLQLSFAHRFVSCLRGEEGERASACFNNRFYHRGYLTVSRSSPARARARVKSSEILARFESLVSLSGGFAAGQSKPKTLSVRKPLTPSAQIGDQGGSAVAASCGGLVGLVQVWWWSLLLLLLLLFLLLP